MWAERGYVAISRDTGGKDDIPEYEGPSGWGGMNQIKEPLTDQWT